MRRLLRGARLLCMALATKSLVAQPTVTTAMMKRGIEALEGYRTGRPMYVVLSPDLAVAPIVVSTKTEADSIARVRGWQTIGPIETPADAFSNTVPYMCVHHYTTAMIAYCNRLRPIPLDSVAEMSITFHMRNGSSRTISVGREADAIFLTGAAMDRFVFPFYAREVGVEMAARMREDMIKAQQRRQP